ncbi:alanine dehydrogenase [Candidatus Desantisbacteria bacterium CG1_02_38_46]|uniref:Alanine dehydrogenase n=3 Tax=unclassified Candidatus Desantisiibacteriota TaxID=3106372 RepID=A0A2H9PBS2_9BACT|nr:MAG: alanine dehydrogenase [Candidatus Desantisbacteria bacterium CG1_02_38_46]PIU50731.1 MAG: alanine dehydrogenase [Candidatus Desantisbacteria bacterium CG07_land_8_20_14_0_80_39_15]PIZ16427.1 MAG: alanine dehydrogenase [Candidatus Desantisbacteria bacterium CG_4_10_14_0_8_um_filter_39_17]
MIIGIPKEIKTDEYRAGIVPVGVETLVRNGHKVLVEAKAGMGSGISDDDYEKSGAKILPSAKEVYEKAEMIIKVKEPISQEYSLIKAGQIVFTYFHFASSEELTKAMMERKAVCIAYETIQTPDGKLPLLVPMSEIAGRMSAQEGAKYLEKPMEGKGILLSGIPGVARANVLILGAGVVGTNAAKIAAGLGANVTIMDINLDRLRYLDDVMPSNVSTLMCNSYNIKERLPYTDLLIGAVLIPGAKTPRLVTKDMIPLMTHGSVIVDVSIDQGGCIETSHPTTHKNPTYIVDGVVHYCVTNMPGAVGRTSTYGLANATLPYALEIANKGYKKASKENKAIKWGLNIVEGEVTYKAVADAFGLKVSGLDI